jgi:hypothetical protein
MLGRSVRDVGDDEAGIEPQLGCFNAGAGAPLAISGFGGEVRLRVAPQDWCRFQRAAGTDVIGLNVDGGGEKLVARQSEDVIETIVFAPVHHVVAAIMAVAPDVDLGCGPVCADATDGPAQMAAHFLAGRRLAWPQNDRDGAPCRGIVDMNRQEAAIILMRVEQRELLVTNARHRKDRRYRV